MTARGGRRAMLEGDTRDLGAQSPSPTWSASAARHAGFFVFIYGLFVWFRRCRRVPARGCSAPGAPVGGVNEVPVAQRIARRTSNPKVAGSIPARDGWHSPTRLLFCSVRVSTFLFSLSKKCCKGGRPRSRARFRSSGYGPSARAGHNLLGVGGKTAEKRRRKKKSTA